MSNKWCLKSIVSLAVMFLIIDKSCAFDLDYTVDDDIRKNYNSSKLVKDTKTDALNEELPSLPLLLKESSTNVSSTSQNNAVLNVVKPMQSINTVLSTGNNIKKGSKIDVVNITKVNDWFAKGNTLKFKTTNQIVNKNYYLPTETVFNAEILEVHQPQITCNGGLVVLRVKNMTFNNHQIPVNAYIIKANSKRIFLNNIKGERTYLKTVWKKGNWGRTIFNKMLTLTVNLSGEGSTLLFSPFPFAYGTICLGLNTLTSPICAIFNKGGHVNIPPNSKFEIRFLEDATY